MYTRNYYIPCETKRPVIYPIIHQQSTHADVSWDLILENWSTRFHLKYDIEYI